MKKLTLLSIMMVIGMSLAGCSKPSVSSDQNQNINSGTMDSQNSKETATIAIEEAKDIALNEAKLTRDDVTFIKTEKNTDNGVEKYDVQFYSGDIEYDYKINVADGKIIEFNQDIEGFDINNDQNSTNTAKVTLEEAKNIALKHADLVGKEVTFIKAERDLDNGVEVYEIEFLFGDTEYDYDINPVDGKIIDYEH